VGPAREILRQRGEPRKALAERFARATSRRKGHSRTALVAIDPVDVDEPDLGRVATVRASTRRHVELADLNDPDALSG
jgi:hypothetical protein